MLGHLPTAHAAVPIAGASLVSGVVVDGAAGGQSVQTGMGDAGCQKTAGRPCLLGKDSGSLPAIEPSGYEDREIRGDLRQRER